MATNSQKPLPSLPRPRLNSQNLTTLTFQSKTHLAALIRHFLSDVDQAKENSDADAWAEAIESALAELGNSIALGGWLAGLKRRKKLQKLLRDKKRVSDPSQDKAKAKREQEQIWKGKQKKKTAQGTESSPDSSSELQAPECRGPFARPRMPQSRGAETALALEQIRELLKQPVVPAPKPPPKHLLLTVAPISGAIAHPTEDSDFDLVPANIGCV